MANVGDCNSPIAYMKSIRVRISRIIAYFNTQYYNTYLELEHGGSNPH